MILFLIRRYNDIDHLTPVIHELLKSKQKCTVLSINPHLKIHYDKRLNYLKSNFDVKIDYFNNINNGSFLNKIFYYLISNVSNINKNDIFIKISILKFLKILNVLLKKFTSQSFYNKLINSVFNYKFNYDVISKISPQIIVMDWVKEYQHNTHFINKVAKIKNIPLVALPHGIPLWTNNLGTYKEVELGTTNDKKNFDFFDHLVVTTKNEMKRKINNGINKNKITSLGSPRFSKQWKKIYDDIYKEESIPFIDNNKINVVFMEHSYHYLGNKEITLKSLELISKLDFVNLLIKPHTRNNKFFNSELLNFGVDCSDFSSLSLIKSSDVIICTISSILIEVLLQNKILIYPNYFDKNHMIFQDMKACWEVNNENELINSFHKLKTNKNFKSYSKSSVDSFLNEVIYNGNQKINPLSSYKDFILSKKIKP